MARSVEVVAEHQNERLTRSALLERGFGAEDRMAQTMLLLLHDELDLLAELDNLIGVLLQTRRQAVIIADARLLMEDRLKLAVLRSGDDDHYML